jgi:hypothetical protein
MTMNAPVATAVSATISLRTSALIAAPLLLTSWGAFLGSCRLEDTSTLLESSSYCRTPGTSILLLLAFVLVVDLALRFTMSISSYVLEHYYVSHRYDNTNQAFTSSTVTARSFLFFARRRSFAVIPPHTPNS